MPVIAKKKNDAADAPVVYPDLVVSGAKIEVADTEITEPQAREMLGYEEEAEGVKFGGDYLFALGDGRKVRCAHNTRNRPLDEAHARKLAQDILNGHWKLNLETIIVGLHGQVLSGQHRLLALIIAVREWRDGPNAEHWRSRSAEEPVLRSLVAFGCSEDKETTRTLDNVKPRSLADVLFADGEMFKSAKTTDRKVLTGMVDYAIRCLWHRTGAKNDAYSPVRTHSESLDFLATHMRLVRCVKHIYEEDGDGHRIKNLVPLGTASGLLYMMACAETEPADYEGGEESLKFTLWERACEFWTKLAAADGGFRLVRNAIGYLASEDGEAGGTSAEKIALVIRAWQVFSAGGPLTDKSLGYEYATGRDGGKRMVGPPAKKSGKSGNGLLYTYGEDHGHRLGECPSVGGIDLGDPDEARREQEAAAREARAAERQKLKDAERALKDAAKQAAPAESRSEVLTRVRQAHPEKLLLFAVSDGSGYTCWGGDALRAHKHLPALPAPALVDGLQKLFVPNAQMPLLVKSRLPLGVCGRTPDGAQGYLGEYTPGGFVPPAEAPAPAAAPLPRVAGKPAAKPAPVSPAAAKVNGAAKAPAKPAGKQSTKPVLRGGK